MLWQTALTMYTSLEPETMLHEGDSFRVACFALRLLFKGSRLRLHQGKLVCFCAYTRTPSPQLTMARDIAPGMVPGVSWFWL
jgi:hypothetical protein